MRIATYNIRNGRALDRASLWWRRRDALATVVRAVDADLWAMQEAYRFQIDWLRRTVFEPGGWDVAGRGRGAGDRGEHVPLWWRTDRLRCEDHGTRWFGPEPDRPGARVPGARFPRIATIGEFRLGADHDDGHDHPGQPATVVNLHLDERSAERRAHSVEQLLGWVGSVDDRPLVVLGDFNAAPSEPAVRSLLDAGLRRVLTDAAGPTSNGFGRDLADQRQIDHILVSPHWTVGEARVVTEAGFASDHWPVVADLTLA